MRNLVLIAALALLVAPAAQAQSSDCYDCDVVQNEVPAPRKKSTRKGRTASGSGISRQDRENLDRAMSRNILRSAIVRPATRRRHP
jgi:hypothetical protein